jgi:uncharacterized protein (TIGR00251 family)
LKAPVAKVAVQVVTRARTTQLIGAYGDAIRIRVAAPPVDGAANEELVRFMAKRLGVSRAAVTIARGQSSRRKSVTIEGISTDVALARLLEDK